MSKDFILAWYDGLLKKSGIPYPIICSILGLIAYLIYLFLARMMGFEWYPEEKIGFMLMGFLIAYQLFGVQYLLDKFKNILLHITSLNESEKDGFYCEVRDRFTGSLWYYALLAIVILPFYLTDWISSDYTLKENYTLMEQFLPYYLEEQSFWILAYDIYEDLIGLLALVLLSYILWIILNTTWTLRDMNFNSKSFFLNTNVLSIQLRLIPIKGLILSILFYYFICISLLILSYGLSDYILEKVTLAAFLLIGLVLFFVGYESLNNILRHQVDFEMDQLNKKSRDLTQRLLTIELSGDYSSKLQETNFISNMLDVLQKQRDSLAKSNSNIFDLKSIFSILSAFILPILTDIAKKNLNTLLQSGEIFNQGLSILNSLIHKMS